MLRGKENVFEQIASNYKKLIITGVLKKGEFLPSCRELARELGINPNTVARSYKVLEDEGYVVAVIKKGVYVSYGEDKQNKNLDEFKKYLERLNNDGFTYEELNDALNEVIKGGTKKWFLLLTYVKVLDQKSF